MEKKTIGKFISALRRAKGLTQRELGDMLYVSDKTISRWENDECTPDLNLIPAIADIFGVTCDELLRGEKTFTAQSGAEQPAGDTATSVRGKKQLEAILRRKYSLFRNLSFIPFGLALLGLVVAIICAFAGADDEITWLGFVLAAFLTAVGIICEVCFALNGAMRAEDDWTVYTDEIAAHNAKLMRLAMAAIYANLFIFGLSFPLAVYDNFSAGMFILPGFGLGCVLVLAAYGIYFKCIRTKMINAGMLNFTGEHNKFIDRNNRRLLSISLVFGIIYILLIILLIVFTSINNYNPEFFYTELDHGGGVYYGMALIADITLSAFIVPVAGTIIYFAIYFAKLRKQKLNK